jgi:competence protein ComEA
MQLIRTIAIALLLCAPVLASAEPVNINTADAATLSRELKGIGEVRARAIIEHRTQHGAFRNADELALVKGIGQKVIERNRANIRVDRVARGPAGTASPAAARPAAPAAPVATRR